MDIGLKISAALHVVLILLALFGGQIFRADDTPPDVVTTVSLISQGELALLAQPQEASQPLQSPPNTQPETAEENDDPVLPEGVPDEGVAASEDNLGELVAEEPDPEVKPEAADVITNEVNEKPDPVVQEAPVETQATEATEGEDQPDEAQEATQQEATTTEIVTEAEEAAPTGAPVRTAIPRARPERPIPEPQPETEIVEEQPDTAPELSVEDQIQAEIERALEQALATEPSTEPAGNSDQGDPSPVPLTATEANALIFNIQSCWSLPVGMQNLAELTVVLGIDLNPQGFVDGTPSLVEPSSLGRPGIQQAYDAATRAVLNCQPYNLPVEKYDAWKQLEIVFNPEKMVNR
ncbi:MAG: hypothetical protein AAF198_01515 [Pseudomonadota bacterium]